MTKEEIIELSDKADVEADKVLNMVGEYHPDWHTVRDEIFAKLVAEKEREECAKTAENINSYDRDEPETSIAQEIRARGQDAKTKE